MNVPIQHNQRVDVHMTIDHRQCLGAPPQPTHCTAAHAVALLFGVTCGLPASEPNQAIDPGRIGVPSRFNVPHGLVRRGMFVGVAKFECSMMDLVIFRLHRGGGG